MYPQWLRGEGGGASYKMGRGGGQVLSLQKGEGADKVLTMPKGGWGIKSCEVV